MKGKEEMEQRKKLKTEIKWAMIIGVLIIAFFIGFFVNLHQAKKQRGSGQLKEEVATEFYDDRLEQETQVVFDIQHKKEEQEAKKRCEERQEQEVIEKNSSIAFIEKQQGKQEVGKVVYYPNAKNHIKEDSKSERESSESKKQQGKEGVGKKQEKRRDTKKDSKESKNKGKGKDKKKGNQKDKKNEEQIEEKERENKKEEKEETQEEKVKEEKKDDNLWAVFYPKSIVKLTIPEYSHIDQDFSVEIEKKYVKTVDWYIREEVEGELKETTQWEGNLTEDGGRIQITKAGIYQIQAVVRNWGNQTYLFEKEIKIYPVAEFSFSLPKAIHIDKKVQIEVQAKELQEMKAEWSILKDGKIVAPKAVIDGELTNEGGEIQFKRKGNYILIATLFDETGREYRHEEKITVYPVAKLSFSLPLIGHTDSKLQVKVETEELQEMQIEWKLLKDGKIVAPSEVMEGKLTNEGGTIQLKQKGDYTLIATMFDELGREYTYQEEIRIYPVAEFTFTLPKATHTDEKVEVKVQAKELQDMEAEWKLMKDGKIVAPSVVTEGDLTNEGGIIQLKQKGNYTLLATLFDETGREYYHKETIQVYPVAEFTFTLPKAAHTDSKVQVEVEAKELQEMKAEWRLIKDGKIVAPSAVMEGELTNEGGTVRLKQKGNYILIATLFDELGREYQHKETIKVYPVAKFSFAMPKTTHTDTKINVEVEAEELQEMQAEWQLIKDGKIIAPSAVLEGNLTNEGGVLQFQKKGKYTLIATLFDELGREYEHRETIVVYPVAELGFYLPSMIHTDETIEVKTYLKEIEDNEVIWSLKKDGEKVELEQVVKGNLKKEGGKIQYLKIGEYQLCASITDRTGRVFQYEQSVKVLPVISMELNVTKAMHTDKKVSIDLTTKNKRENKVTWRIYKEEIPVEIKHNLTETGGELQLEEKGNYRIKASVVDEAGREFSCEEQVKIYPIPSVKIQMPTAVHTDDTFTIQTITKDIEETEITWYVDNTSGFQDWNTYVEGTLTAQGGTIRLKRAGVYDFQVRAKDKLGRIFTFDSGKIEVLPVLQISFTLPQNAYTDTSIDVRTRGNNSTLPVEWNLSKDGTPIAVSNGIDGALNEYGGKIRFKEKGVYRLTARMVDALGRVFEHTETIQVYSLYNCNFTMPISVRPNQNFAVTVSPNDFTGVNVVWTETKDGGKGSGFFQGSLGNQGGTVRLNEVGTYTLTATITDSLGRVFTKTNTITVINHAPNTPTATAQITRTVKNQKLLVNLQVSSSDPDGDSISYEYQNKTGDNYYPVGTHTVFVRAKDSYGAVSAWKSVTFTLVNSAPTRPTITRTPNGNSVAPGTPVTLKASSTDANGDEITYVWEGRPQETMVYSLGKHTVRVKAVDSLGAESPWAAIVFFVMDSNGSGGMMLTGPNSTIMENGLEGATITKYTFTVPAVYGHYGSDYGRVRGYNIKTGVWDQLDYQTTENGISFTRTLPSGTYSKLEMYYYTNHNCMYNKSNITYTVEYYFQ